jgi:putative intracellular protease/amidase
VETVKVLLVLTSHDRLGDTGAKTGFWLEELAAPWYVFREAGAEVVLASPLGGRPPLDPRSELPEFDTDATRRFRADAAANRALADTRRLADVRADDFETVFYPGGHGPMWDLPDNPASIALIEAFLAARKPVAAVCHAPVALTNVRDERGAYVVAGRDVTGFTNSEEAAMGLEHVVPFLLEDRLKERGARFHRDTDFAAFVVEDGLLVTGQNPASSGPAARTLLALVGARVPA